MKIIHIFLASSITDLQSERTELSSYFRMLNDRFMEKGIYFRLHMCEDISDEIAMTRKQDEYNGIIRDCDYFYIMFWRKAGAYTIEEFNTAFERFKTNGAPKIVTFFKEVEGDIPSEVMAFMEHLDKELQHYYTKFQNIDSVKLKILLEMVKMPELNAKVELKDAGLFVDGDKVNEINLDNIPFYAKHENLQKLRLEVAALDQQFAEAKKASRLDPDNDELWQACYEISQKRNTALGALHDIEMQLIAMSARLVELSSTGEWITPRTKLAIELFEKGDLQGAKETLDEAEYEEDKNRAIAKAEEMKKELQALVKERTVKIDIIMAEGLTDSSAKEIEAIYDDIAELFFAYRLSGPSMLAYVKFLWRQKNLPKALTLGERLYHYYSEQKDRSLHDWAQINNRLAVLYSESNQNTRTEPLFLEAIACQKELARSGDENNLSALAVTYNNLAVEYVTKYRYEEAEECHLQALAIRRKLAQTDKDDHLRDLSLSCNNYSILLRRTKRHDEAEKMNEEALRIRRELVKRDRKTNIYNLSCTCHNFALFYSLGEIKEKYDRAEALFNEAIELRRELSSQNPDAYLGYLAGSLSSCGSFFRRQERYAEAEACFKESITYKRKLAEKDFITHGRDLATTLSTFSFLYEDMKKYEEALLLAEESLAIVKRLYETNPEVQKPNLAREYFFVGLIYEKLGQTDKTLEYYLKCLALRRELYEEKPQRFAEDLSSILDFLGYLHDDLGQPEEAEAYRRESDEISRSVKE